MNRYDKKIAVILVDWHPLAAFNQGVSSRLQGRAKMRIKNNFKNKTSIVSSTSMIIWHGKFKFVPKTYFLDRRLGQSSIR